MVKRNLKCKESRNNPHTPRTHPPSPSITQPPMSEDETTERQVPLVLTPRHHFLRCLGIFLLVHFNEQFFFILNVVAAQVCHLSSPLFLLRWYCPLCDTPWERNWESDPEMGFSWKLVFRNIICWVNQELRANGSVNDQSWLNCFSEGRNEVVWSGLFTNREQFVWLKRTMIPFYKSSAQTHPGPYGHRWETFAIKLGTLSPSPKK